jgi:hypothetical protein
MISRRAPILAIFVVAVGGIVAWQVGVAGSGTHKVSKIADAGKPVAKESLPTWQQRLLHHADLSADLRIRRRAPDGVTFLTYKNSAGALCFSANGGADCPSSGHAFFENAPVADVMVIDTAPDKISGPLVAWRGLALDGVSKVVVIDTAGKQSSAPVVNNTFELQGPISNPTTFEALDSSDKVIWTRHMTWPKS